MRPSVLRRRLWAAAAGAVLAATGILAGFAPDANADPAVGCETVRWGFLGSERRTVCDGPMVNGSWQRTRVFWKPAYSLPFRCNTSGGTYFSTTECYPARYVPERLIGRETYVVTAGTVLPDEPGHLAAGTDVFR